MEKIITEGMELIESEFSYMSQEELMENVQDLLSEVGMEYIYMSDVDKFDYLVDGILYKN